MSKAETVSVVPIGIGGYGHTYVRSLLENGRRHGLELVGAVDPQPEKCPLLSELKAQGIPVLRRSSEFYGSHRADLAVISAPIHLHHRLTLEALQHGSHVLCEKPAGADLEQAVAMRDAARAAGRTLAIGFQDSFSARSRELKKRILEGRFGAPRRLRTVIAWPRTDAYYARAPWAGRVTMEDGSPVFDSPANNATAHYLHSMFFLLGEDETAAAMPVRVQAELYRANTIQH